MKLSLDHYLLSSGCKKSDRWTFPLVITVGETPNVTTAPQAYEPDPDVIPNVELTVNIVEHIDCCWRLWDAIPVTVPILTPTIADRKKNAIRNIIFLRMHLYDLRTLKQNLCVLRR